MMREGSSSGRGLLPRPNVAGGVPRPDDDFLYRLLHLGPVDSRGRGATHCRRRPDGKFFQHPSSLVGTLRDLASQCGADLHISLQSRRFLRECWCLAAVPVVVFTLVSS